MGVDPQLQKRTADQAVYCSCRCDGEDKSARYCKCPSGYACTPIQSDIGLGDANLFGSYCVRDGTQYENLKDTTPCSPQGAPKVAGETTCGDPEG